MFKEWGFLLTEIWVLLALMALIGLFAGWLIWGGAPDCSECEKASAAKDAELKRLRAELDAKEAALAAEKARVIEPVPAPEPEPIVEAIPVAAPVAAPVIEEAAPEVGVKPEGLDAARDGIPDDLKLIKGVGPKMEKLCNSLGYYHFDQIAAWTPSEVAWVDDNLEGFKGRVTRDNWVSQAKTLAKS